MRTLTRSPGSRSRRLRRTSEALATGLVVDGEDHVTGLDPGALRRRVLADVGDEDAMSGRGAEVVAQAFRQRLQADAELDLRPAAMHAEPAVVRAAVRAAVVAATEADVGRPRGEGRLELAALAGALDDEARDVAGPALADRLDQPAGIGDGRAVHLDDAVARLEAGGGRRRAGLDLDHARRGPRALEVYAEPGATLVGLDRVERQHESDHAGEDQAGAGELLPCSQRHHAILLVAPQRGRAAFRAAPSEVDNVRRRQRFPRDAGPTPPRARYNRLPVRTLLALGLAAAAIACRSPAREPGTAVVLLEGAPESLDRRFTLSANGQRVASLIAPGLVRIDASGQPVPDLAASIERLSPKRYRFTLRPGLTFHDGAPLTSRDVVYTFESLRDPDVGSPLGPRFDPIARVVAVDELTVEIEFHHAYAPALVDLNMGIVPARLADPAERPAFAERPIGAGPFRFVARPDEEHIVLAPNASYYGGRPAIERLEFTVVRDETTRLLALLHGDADLLQGAISPVLLPRLDRAEHLEVQTRPGVGYAYLGFNLRHPILADVRVRRAFAHAIDRDTIARYKFRGAAAPATGLLPAHHWAFAESDGYEHDPDRARALLDEAGYPDPDGDGPAKRFEITYKTSTDRFRKAVALVIAAQLEAVGIGVDLRAYEWGTFYGDVKRGRFEVITLKWLPVIDPHLMHWVFHSDSIPSEANDWVGGNRGAYRNPAVDRLLDEAAGESSVARRRALYGEVQIALARDLPYVPLWHEDTVAVVSTRLASFELSPFGFLYPLADARLVR